MYSQLVSPNILGNQLLIYGNSNKLAGKFNVKLTIQVNSKKNHDNVLIYVSVRPFYNIKNNNSTFSKLNSLLDLNPSCVLKPGKIYATQDSQY